VSGHGHVTPRADGVKARCGGPALCPVCARELAVKEGRTVMRHHDQPSGRQPTKTRVNTVTVDCGRTGPEAVIEEHNIRRLHTLADIEEWTAELRRLGAGDDLVLKEADGLIVTLDITS